MLRKATSGQFVYFSLVSAISGNPVTGASGQISGRKATDGISGMIVLSGNIIELGGGAYRANLFDQDCSGDYMGYLFTSSGTVPVCYSLVTFGGASGALFGMMISGGAAVLSGNLSGQPVTLLSGRSWTASGINATVPAESISGVVANSGLFVTVPIASISGAVGNSGQFVTVPIATISGAIANSGLFVSVPIATISGTVVNSGLFASVPIATISGVVANSGLFVSVPVASISGVFPASGALSGQRVDLISGNSVSVWSGTSVNPFSGTVWLPSGSVSAATFASGFVSGDLPRNVLLYDFTAFSGIVASGSSGRTLMQSARKLINRWRLGTDQSGRLVVYQEDDTAIAYRQDFNEVSGGNPIDQLDTI